MILGASRWLEPNAPSAANRPAAIAAARARISTAGLRIAHSLMEVGGRPLLRSGAASGSKSPCERPATRPLAQWPGPGRSSLGGGGQPLLQVLEQRADRLHD